jgi:hypothetical protein
VGVSRFANAPSPFDGFDPTGAAVVAHLLFAGCNYIASNTTSSSAILKPTLAFRFCEEQPGIVFLFFFH